MAQQENIVQAVRKYSDRLFGFIRGRVDRDADAEDILQEVWYQFSRLMDTSSIENVSAWLYRVARNKITDRYRKQQPTFLEDLTYEDNGDELRLADLLLQNDETPETEFIRQAIWEEMMEAIDELPEKQRDVFVWNELEGRTFREISEESGINIKTLISRKQYAVKYLRSRLQPIYDELLN